jgi:hypothetical protein
MGTQAEQIWIQDRKNKSAPGVRALGQGEP